MSEDLTKKLANNDRDAILTAINNLDSYVRSAIDSLTTWVAAIDSRLQRLEQRVEERLHDTRPIWHKVVADIAELQAGQQRLEEGQQRLQQSQQRLEQGQEEIKTQICELSITVREVDRDQIVINEAIRKFNSTLPRCWN